ncbi:MAG: hypothetical protein C7B44_09640, partial [Sulfobacillus thermosulfidooxidans]
VMKYLTTKPVWSRKVSVRLMLLLIMAGVVGWTWGKLSSKGPALSPPPFAGPTQGAAQEGILTRLHGEKAPNWSLIDQRGQRLSLSHFKGKAVILIPIDPVCTTVCPVVAGEMKNADRLLGSLSKHVAIVGFNVNPYWTSVGDINAFDVKHHLTSMANWYFLTGSVPSLTKLWSQYHILVQQFPQTRSVYHTTYFYFIGPHGHERWLLGGSPKTSLTTSYSTLIADIVRTLIVK